MDFLSGVYSGLMYGKLSSWIDWINFLLGVLILAGFTGLVVVACFKIAQTDKSKVDAADESSISKGNQNDHKKAPEDNWKFLTEEFQKDAKFSFIVAILLGIQDYLIAPFIIIGMEHTNV